MKCGCWNRMDVWACLAVSALVACSKETPKAVAEVAVSSGTAVVASAAASPDAAGTPTPASSTASDGPSASAQADRSANHDGAPPSGAATASPSVGATAAAVASAAASPEPSAAPSTEPSAPPVDGVKKTGAQYAAYLSGPKKVKAGNALSLSAVFTASGTYHCNEKYPTSFKPDAAPEGVSFASDKFTGAAFTAKRSQVPVSLTATSKGVKTVTGTLKFGVCDEAECIPVKAPVAFSFEVE